MISSTSNPKIKTIRQLQTSSKARQRDNVLVVEGVRLVEEALAAGWHANLVLYTDELSKRGKALIDTFIQRGSEVIEVTPAVLRSACDTETPQGLLAVLKNKTLPIPGKLDFVFIPDCVRDPGNLGTLLRTSIAAGVQLVCIPPGTTDPFSPKVMRSAMGAHFRLPILCLDWEAIGKIVHENSLQVFLAAAAKGEIYHQAAFHNPLALVIGGEAAGAGAESRLLATHYVHIPMPGDVESLNAAVAGGILLFEIVRQRIHKENK
jgi:TrmH family RNA methyltransferase